MKKHTLGWSLLVLLAAFSIGGGCGGDSSTEPIPEPLPHNLPAIPEPASTEELMPARSPEIVIGMSAELESFEPMVSRLQKMKDDGTRLWTEEHRHLPLACPGLLTLFTSDTAADTATYITARPYLLHTRHWQRLEQNTLDPGTNYTLQTSVTWGASTSHTESTEFSRTMGIETTVGGSWGPFSAEVKASYEQTTTTTEVESVTFSEEESEERTYQVQAPATGTRVYVLWQLVDEFSLVDADMIDIDQSPILAHVEIPAIARIRFANKSVTRMQTTDFD